MVETVNRISATELFGGSSELVLRGAEVADLGIASLGVAYQVATGVVALLFAVMLMRYYELIRHLLLSFVSRRVNRPEIHIYAAEIHNVEILTSVAGVSLISLFVMRLSVMPEVRTLLAPILGYTPWSVGGVVFAGTFALILWERLMLYLVELFGHNNTIGSTIWQTKMLHFSATILFVAPMLILSLLTAGRLAQIALFTSVAICSISLILFVKETFLLFRAQRFSIFHWFLYLCALEIFPLSLLLAPIARG